MGAGRTSFDVVVVVASLGGPPALCSLLRGLPGDFPVPLLLVQHGSPGADSLFVHVLQRRTRLAVRAACDGQQVGPVGASVLPARHTGRLGPAGVLSVTPTDDFRVADPLITSVAATYGARGLCVVLTGRLDDTAAGVRALKRRGGRTIVEDPRTARAPGMPSAALATGCVDLALPLDLLPPAVIALTMAPGAADLLRVPPSPWAYLAA
jgi:two-component system, chemotaxis family, protein-glutamate methylesterase/glutaminase